MIDLTILLNGLAGTEDPFVIEAGATETQLLIDGSPVDFDGCTITETFIFEIFGVTTTTKLNAELDGNTLTGTLEIIVDGEVDETCTINYSK